MKHRDIHMKLSDIITTQHGKTVIASGKHRQPISCNSCRYKTLSHIDVPCVNCRCDGEKSSEYEPIGNISEHVCDDCKYIDTQLSDEPCNHCVNNHGYIDSWCRFKPSREDTERIIMDSMKQIRDAYKGYCDADIQRLYLCFTDGKISFFNNFWKEDSGTPINKYEVES